jgi:DnaK suppressor protein
LLQSISIGKELMIVQTDLNPIRQSLESQLQKAASICGVSDSIRIQQVADPVDMTQQAAERDVAVQILERESMLVRRLRSAIDRIDHGSYGICVQCEEEIAPKRLSAMPWAELCIHCQQATENQATKRESRRWFEDQSEAA